MVKKTKLNFDDEFSLGNFFKVFFKKVPWLVREETIPLHAAALTFFALFSFLPLLVLIYMLFNKLSEGILLEFLMTTQGIIGSDAVNSLMDSVNRLPTFDSHNWIIYVVALMVVLYAVSRFMYFLQKSMNHIWKVKTSKGWFRVELRHRAISFLSLLLLLFLATVLVLQKVALIAFQRMLGFELTMIIYYTVLSISIYSIVAIIYKVIPDRKIEWSDVFLGSAFTTIVFWIGLFLLRILFQRSLLNSVYSAISGILLIFLWMYYFAQLIYLGAEITKVYATHFGSLKSKKNLLIDEVSDLEDVSDD